MQIILRGKKVRTTVITKSLSKTEVDYYRPSMRENNTSTPGAVSFHNWSEWVVKFMVHGHIQELWLETRAMAVCS